MNFVAKNFLPATACYPRCILFLFPRSTSFVPGFLFNLVLLSNLISQNDFLLPFWVGMFAWFSYVGLGGFYSAIYAPPQNCLCSLIRCIYFIVVLCLNCSNVKIYERLIFYRKLYTKKAKTCRLYTVILYVFDFAFV